MTGPRTNTPHRPLPLTRCPNCPCLGWHGLPCTGSVRHPGGGDYTPCPCPSSLNRAT